ncbi:MAG TPA: DUF2520 domain-containing protein [Acidimicrobiia bacterium]|nr:DUF2520 domain-containing protein [Acidimicrobiia bacterium]
MDDSTPVRFALVGPGRAGRAVAARLVAVGSCCTAVAGRTPTSASAADAARRLAAPVTDVAAAGRDAALVVVATPDEAIEAAAAALAPGLAPGALVVHLAGARGIDALAPLATRRPDVLVGALHPLQTLTGFDDGHALVGAWAAVDGPPAVHALARALGLRPGAVPDAARPAYHAAAVVASNHLVALLGQVERLAASAGVPFDAFAPLVRASVDHAFAVGPAAALTGPVARGDVATVARHLDALDADEQRTYRALADAARRLAGRDEPAWETVLA